MDEDEMRMREFEPLADALGWGLVSDSVMAWLVTVPDTYDWPHVGPDAIRAAEAEIARRGLSERYGVELLNLLDPDAQVYETAIYPSEPDDSFAWIAMIATASPDVRVRAMLRVLGEG